MGNLDPAVVAGFGDEWSRFDQSQLAGAEYEALFERYFGIFPWDRLPANAEGFDLGCGSGRWARGVAPRVGMLHCIDASAEALAVAKRNLAMRSNVRFHLAAVDDMPLKDGSQDFGYCLGVLHHVPDAGAGLAVAVRKLKVGAPFLLYLYYAFDNQPWWYRALHSLSEIARMPMSRAPAPVRFGLSQLIAYGVYWPLARTARLLSSFGYNVHSFPLAAYRNSSLYTMRTDALDRFGTRLEQRFTRDEMRCMMERAGLVAVRFSGTSPFWCALGEKS